MPAISDPYRPVLLAVDPVPIQAARWRAAWSLGAWPTTIVLYAAHVTSSARKTILFEATAGDRGRLA